MEDRYTMKLKAAGNIVLDMAITGNGHPQGWEAIALLRSFIDNGAPEQHHARGATSRARSADPSNLKRDLDRVQTWLIRNALVRNGMKRVSTARELGITREGLWKMMSRLCAGEATPTYRGRG